MTKASDKTGEGASETPADFSPVTDALKDTPVAPFNPLLSNPAAAFAAATAIGFGFATQMAGAFLGSLQGAMDMSSKMAKAAEKQRAGRTPAEAPEPAAPEEAPLASEVVANAANLTVVEKPEPTAGPVTKAVAKSKPVPSAKKAPAAAKPSAKTPAAKSKAVKPAQDAAVKATPAKPVAVAKAEKPAAKKPAAKKPLGAKADDLKKISGVGPKLEQMLNGMGVTRYADIAGWSAADVARIDGELELDGRIGRDDWVGKAKALSGGKG